MHSSPKSQYRPLSPHLQIYKPQITSVLSILHRATGIVLFLASFLLSLWVFAINWGKEAYDFLQGWLLSPLGLLILGGWSFAFFYHLLNGIRHLCWDIGWGYDMTTVRRTGWLVVILSLIMTLILWFFVGRVS